MLQEYKCHKKVKARRMLRFIAQEKGLVRDHSETNEVGYYILYEDGFESWSPKEVFEKGYKKTLKEKLWDFGQELKAYFQSVMEYLRS